MERDADSQVADLAKENDAQEAHLFEEKNLAHEANLLKEKNDAQKAHLLKEENLAQEADLLKKDDDVQGIEEEKPCDVQDVLVLILWMALVTIWLVKRTLSLLQDLKRPNFSSLAVIGPRSLLVHKENLLFSA